MPRSRLADKIREAGSRRNKNSVENMEKEFKQLGSELEKAIKIADKKAKKRAKEKKKDKAWIKKQKEKDRKKGIKRSAKEYRKMAVERRETQTHNRKVNAVMRAKGVSRQTAEELIAEKEKAEKAKQRAKAIKLNAWKKRLGIRDIADVKRALDDVDKRSDKELAETAERLRKKRSVIDNGKHRVTFDFSNIDSTKIKSKRVKELEEAGLTLDDAVATAWLEAQGSTKQTFRDPSLPGGKPREWTQAELYRARAMAIYAQEQEEQDIKDGRLPAYQMPQDLMGQGNDDNFFKWVAGKNKDYDVYLPTTSRQRAQYSSGALLTSFDKALSHYLAGNSRLKKLILNKMASISDLKGTLAYSPLISNQDITGIFEGYNIAIAAQDDDAISREIMALAEAVGVDLNAELDGKSVGEAIYFRDGVNPWPDQYDDLDFSLNKKNYGKYVDDNGDGWTQMLENYKKMKGKNVLR
jgi:hypothetical protein